MKSGNVSDQFISQNTQPNFDAVKGKKNLVAQHYGYCKIYKKKMLYLSVVVTWVNGQVNSHKMDYTAEQMLKIK